MPTPPEIIETSLESPGASPMGTFARTRVLAMPPSASGGLEQVYLNVVGGLKVQETAADLAVALAVVSSYTGIAVRSVRVGPATKGGHRALPHHMTRYHAIACCCLCGLKPRGSLDFRAERWPWQAKRVKAPVFGVRWGRSVELVCCQNVNFFFFCPCWMVR